MSERWAVVRGGQIENTILWDGTTPYDPGPGVELVLEAEAIKQGLPAAEPDEAEPAIDLAAQVAQLAAQVADLAAVVDVKPAPGDPVVGG